MVAKDGLWVEPRSLLPGAPGVPYNACAYTHVLIGGFYSRQQEKTQATHSYFYLISAFKIKTFPSNIFTHLSPYSLFIYMTALSLKYQTE